MNVYLVENDFINNLCLIIFALSILGMFIVLLIDLVIRRIPDGLFFRFRNRGIFDAIKDIQKDIDELKKK